MSPTQRLTLQVFQAFTAVTPYMHLLLLHGRGKETAWETWKSFAEVQ